MRIAPVVSGLCLAASFGAAAEQQASEIPVSCRPAAVEQVKTAQRALDNVRVAEANDALRKALEQDGNCALAHAMLAALLPGTDATIDKHLNAATAQASLPEAERTQIELLAAGVRGDNAKARELTARLPEVAPGDWRAHNGLAGLHLADQDYDAAIRECQRALELNPKAGGAWNNLGYSYAGQEKFDDAANAFRKYAEVAPEEPNAHDSLGEVLMNGGHFAESEAEFQKALTLNPQFAGAWTGIAQTRMLRGDDAGAMTALRKELDVDTRPQVRLGSEINIAYALYAQGKAKEAYRQLDQVKSEAGKLKLPQVYFVDAIQARLRMRQGEVKKALALAQASLKDSRAADVRPGLKRGLLQGTLIEVLRAQALLKDAKGSAKSLAEMEEVVKPVAQNAFAASQLENSRGMAAFAAGDAAGAVAAMKKCQRADFQCLFELERAQEALGDTEGARESRAAFLRIPRRGIEYVALWRKLSPEKSAAN